MSLDAAQLAGSLGRIALTLASGVAAGALLSTAYVYSSFGGAFVFGGLVVVMLFYGIAIALICVPIWLILIRLEQDGPWAAMALGFFATSIFLMLTNPTAGQLHLHLMTYTVLPYSICGGIGAAVTWWVGQRLRPRERKVREP